MMFRYCEQCGTITGVEAEGGSIDNREMHAKWHARLDRYIENLYRAACGETQDRLDAIIASQR
jgi:hypothetical protein